MSNKKVVYGYYFDSDEDVIKARKEINNINIIKSKIDVNKPEELFKLYNKLISKKIFETPIGLSFLHEIRTHLIEDLFYLEDDVPIIRVSNQKYIDKLNENKVLKQNNEKLLALKNKLIIITIALGVLVIGMLFLAATNKNIGFINAEEKILDKYSVWQEQLEQKEQELIEREEMLENNKQLENQ